MYLLILDKAKMKEALKKFTFHYVSINMQLNAIKAEIEDYLHSTMYLLI